MAVITVRELRAILDRGDRPLLVDVLFEERFARQHVSGAVSACVYNVTFLDQMAELVEDRDKPVVVYGVDDEDHSAMVAEEKLLQAGWISVFRLGGGIRAWIREGGSVEGEAPASDLDEEVVFQAPSGVVTVLPAESTIGWEGRNTSGSHRGSLDVESGSFRFSSDQASGEVVLDMRSIRNHDVEEESLRSVLVAHLLSEDFFHTDAFPRARLVIETMRPLHREPRQPNHAVQGTLELRGVRAPFECEATLENLEAGRMTLEAHFDLDRTLWGVNYGSAKLFRYLGYHLVFDPISVNVRLVLEA